ncbi:hypothetical protein DL96DRAFT_1704552 [Flagelloscypha sp. PMI_526]|nr:hypothetical protein DL96DRAFT_1704552 [Flagelloscypha sp. PMI_526]
MPSFISVVKRITQRPSKKSSSPSTSKDAQFKTDVRLDYCITSARLLKAAGENLPFPWLKGASDLVLQVLEPLRLARTNQQDFDSLAQDILDTLRPIQDQAARLNLEGSSEIQFVESKCASFITHDMLRDFETVKSDTVNNSSSTWTTHTMQRLIQSYQSRLQKEVQIFNTSHLVEMHASVHKTATVMHLMSTKLDTALAPSPKKQQQSQLENYRSLKAGDLQVVATRNQEHSAESESHILYKGKKTWKTFHDNDAEKKWIQEIQFYHTSRLQPRVRQLFGFTQSQDFLGLVFHEYSMRPDTAWNKMGPIERVLSQAQLFTDWNEVLHFLSSTSFGEVVSRIPYHETYSSPIPSENDGFAIYPLVDSSGALQVTFSSGENQEPGSLFLHHMADFPSKFPSIRDLRDIFVSRSSQVSPTNLIEIQHVFYGLLPSFPDKCEAGVQTNVSLRIDAVVDTNFVSVAEITLPMKSMVADWSCWTKDRGVHQGVLTSKTNWRRYDQRCTSYVTFTGTLEFTSPMCGSPVFQYLPSFWNQVKKSKEFRDKTLSLKLDQPGHIGLELLTHALREIPLNSLYIFLRQELEFQYNGQLDLSDVFYFSFDPLGTSRLTEFELQRFGIVITHSFDCSMDRKCVPGHVVEAILALSDYPGLPDDPVVKSSHRSLPAIQRTSSVDRFNRTPNSHQDHHYPHPLEIMDFTGHATLCHLTGGGDCVCPEARRQYLAAGFKEGFHGDSGLQSGRCSCFPGDDKRRRSRSVDRADRMEMRISRWVNLARNMGRKYAGDLFAWYLHPHLIYHYTGYEDMEFHIRVVSSSWMVDPSEPERVGRPTQSRTHLSS